jgi:H+/Cl- antiporter ClcA
LKELYLYIKQLLRWTVLILPIALLIGSAVALFLWLLSAAIHLRFANSWLLFFLPLAGLLIHLIYKSAGRAAERGNNLILEQIYVQEGRIPPIMAPVIFITTIITHLFGGSAGREGTAVQIGGSMAALYAKWLKLTGIDMRMLLTAGVAAGFGAVFGTPLTGAIFALEVVTLGRIRYDAWWPALVGGIAGDLAVKLWQVAHVHYQIDAVVSTGFALPHYRDTLLLAAKVIVSSAAFGLASLLFIRMVMEVKSTSQKLFKYKWMIPVMGGLIIIGLTLLIGKPDYLSLGVDAEHPGAVTITSTFHVGGSGTWSWLWKTIYTSVTLGTGFKGGEVTPLFYIGATLGNALSALLHAPASLFAALGFIAVFAGATNTPVACTMMGVELFGAEHAVLFGLACFTAFLFSGHPGIYGAHKAEDPQVESESLTKESPADDGYFKRKLSKYYRSGIQ